MKQLALLLLAGALMALILQPVSLTVNTPSGNRGLRADGVYPPPFPPPPDGTRVHGAPSGGLLT